MASWVEHALHSLVLDQNLQGHLGWGWKTQGTDKPQKAQNLPAPGRQGQGWPPC